MSPLHAHTPLHSSPPRRSPGAPGPREALRRPPGARAEQRGGCGGGGGDARRAPGPRPVPRPGARNQTPASGRTGSAASRWGTSADPAAASLSALAQNPALLTCREPGRFCRGRRRRCWSRLRRRRRRRPRAPPSPGPAPPPPPPLVPAPVPASHWPPPPQATRRRCQWPAGLSLSSAIEQPIYFSPARSPASVSRPGLELSRHIWLAPSGLSGCSPSSQQRPQ